tara:strand:- start:530 stop:793 length:264 start_codon:yes stop_codon:yes gene_type:complete
MSSLVLQWVNAIGTVKMIAIMKKYRVDFVFGYVWHRVILSYKYPYGQTKCRSILDRTICRMLVALDSQSWQFAKFASLTIPFAIDVA